MLSVKGLVFNLGYGAMSLGFSALLAASASQQNTNSLSASTAMAVANNGGCIVGAYSVGCLVAAAERNRAKNRVNTCEVL